MNKILFSIFTEPTFSNLPASVDINETLSVDTEIFTLTVSDSDSTWNGAVSISSQTPDGFFKVDGTSVKTMSDELDAETETSYSLKFKYVPSLMVTKHE